MEDKIRYRVCLFKSGEAILNAEFTNRDEAVEAYEAVKDCALKSSPRNELSASFTKETWRAICCDPIERLNILDGWDGEPQS